MVAIPSWSPPDWSGFGKRVVKKRKTRFPKVIRKSLYKTPQHISFMSGSEMDFGFLTPNRYRLPTGGDFTNFKFVFDLFSVKCMTDSSAGVLQPFCSNSQGSPLSLLFDMYKIMKVIVTFRVMNSLENSIGSSSATNHPILYVAPADDITTVRSVDAIRQADGCKTVALTYGTEKTITLFPEYESLMYQSSTEAIAGRKRGFVPLGVTGESVPHTGCDVALGYPNQTGSHRMYVDFKYYLALRGTK